MPYRPNKIFLLGKNGIRMFASVIPTNVNILRDKVCVPWLMIRTTKTISFPKSPCHFATVPRRGLIFNLVLLCVRTIWFSHTKTCWPVHGNHTFSRYVPEKWSYSIPFIVDSFVIRQFEYTLWGQAIFPLDFDRNWHKIQVLVHVVLLHFYIVTMILIGWRCGPHFLLFPSA